VPAREEFRARGSAFRMVEVGSPSEAVLDYYEIAGAKRLGPWSTLAPTHPLSFERLPLIATAKGRRTLAVGGRRYPLYRAAPRHLTIAIEKRTCP